MATHEDVIAYIACSEDVDEVEEIYNMADNRLEQLGYYAEVDLDKLLEIEDDTEDQK